MTASNPDRHNPEIVLAQNYQSAIDQAINHHNIMVEFVKKVLKPNIDYGVIPGTKKPTLLKPGAEKMCRLFNLRPQFELIASDVNFDKPIFHYHYRCTLYRNGEAVGQGEGNCNSYEKKYRWRKAELTCPGCDSVGALIKGRREYGGGWLCYGKKGGCGAKFTDNDPKIKDQNPGEVENPEIFDLTNTICKMAQKRAMIAAVLHTCGASEFFTQDLEIINID